jgi:hypothetical protein
MTRHGVTQAMYPPRLIRQMSLRYSIMTVEAQLLSHRRTRERRLMAKFWEHLNESDRAAVMPVVEEALIQLASVNEGQTTRGKPKSSYTWESQRQGDDELAEPMLRYVHARLMAMSQQDSTLPKPYTHVFAGEIIVPIREMLGGVGTDKEMTALRSQMMRVFALNKFLVRGPRYRVWWLRRWPLSQKAHLTVRTRDALSSKDQAVLAVRITQETKPVHSTHRLSVISTPDRLTPESAVEYFAKIKSAYDHLAAAHDQLRREHNEAMTELEDLRHRAEDSEGWASALDKMKDLLKSHGPIDLNGEVEETPDMVAPATSTSR